MKKSFVLLLLIASTIYSQGWNNTVTTSIYDGNLLGMDLFTNTDGNNLVELSWNGQFAQIYYVKYHLLNSSGSVIRSSTIETFGPYQGSIEYVNISGNNDKVYVVYKIGGVIRAKKSTNAGVSWTTYDLSNPAGSGAFDYIDIVFDNTTNKLHVVYARGSFGYPDQVTHYYSLSSEDQWGEYKKVSDYGDEWTKPTVSFSEDRVHVSYHEDDAMSRDKYLANWQNPATLASSLIERIHAGSSKLFYFYDEPQPELDVDLYVKLRNLDGSSWSSPILLHENANFYSPFVSATNTTDGKTHIVYEGPGNTVYRNYNGSTWSSELTVGDWYKNPLISSVSNDLFVIWMGSNNYIKYRHYDAAPLAPQNLTVSQSGNNHPLLNWSANQEPDMNNYQVWKKGGDEGGGWHLKYTTSNTSYEDPDEIVVAGPKQANEGKAYYYIKAVDLGNHISGSSNEVNIRVGIEAPSKYFSDNGLSNTEMKYSLSQNYPNPFNPSTEIKYSLAEDSYVTVRVYDVLGTEVKELVSNTQTAGAHTINFNASNLPSGVYIYRITASHNGRIEFTESKQMILMK